MRAFCGPHASLVHAPWGRRSRRGAGADRCHGTAVSASVGAGIGNVGKVVAEPVGSRVGWLVGEIEGKRVVGEIEGKRVVGVWVVGQIVVGFSVVGLSVIGAGVTA